MTTYYDDMSESAALNFLAGTTDFGDASAIRRIAAYIDAATGSGSPEGAVTGNVGDLYTDYTNGHLYIKASGTGNTGWVQLESATSGSGDVNGPGSATDNALVRFDGTGGKTVQNSGITVDDSGYVTSHLTMSRSAPRITISSPAGETRYVRIQSALAQRWAFGGGSAAESGSNAGTDFVVLSYTDAEAFLRTDLTINRATGKWTFGSVGATAGLELGSSGPRVMSGTGSPEGVVTAPVGSTWVRTDGATLGDFRYSKQSGTGSTGWVVSEGDTGWRNVAAAMSNDADFTIALSRIRRVGQTVEFLCEFTVGGSYSSGDILYSIPAAFKPHNPGANYYGLCSTYTGTALNLFDGDYLRIYAAAATTYRIRGVWTTTATWPASLPGSAV